MLFSSIPFLYYFLPVVLILYFVAPKILKNPVLLIASLVFYGWGEPKYVFLMIATVLAGYVFGLLIDKFRGKMLSKVFMITSVLFSLAGLVYFKYVFHAVLPPLQLTDQKKCDDPEEKQKGDQEKSLCFSAHFGPPEDLYIQF